MGKLAFRTEEGNLSGDVFVKKETKSSDVRNSRSRRKKQNIGKTSCNPIEVIPVQRQAKPEKSKQNGRSGKAKDTREKTARDVRKVSPTGKEKEIRERTAAYVREVARSDEPLVKNLARSGEEKAKEANCLVKERARCGEDKEANVSDNHPVQKLAEATSQQMCRPGKQNSRDGIKSSDDRSRKRNPDEVDSLPPEKQVEVAYEETRVVPPSKKSIHQDQRDVLCDDGINARVQESKRGGSDMSMSSPQTSNAQYRSRSNSPFVPAEQPSGHRTAHLDGNTNYHVNGPHIPTFKSNTYQGSYLARSDGHYNALEEKNDPMLYSSADDISRKYSSSTEEPTQRYAAAPAGDVYGTQAHGDGSNLYRRQDDYLQTGRYSLGSSGGRYDQPSLTSQSYGISGTTASRSSVMDRYGSGLFGANGSGASVMDKYGPALLGPGAGSSVMDRYAPPLADTNYITRGVPDVPGYGGNPPQNPYRGPGSSGRGPPYH